MSLAAGDLLVVFSDGISEALNAGEEEFGEERVARFVAENRTLQAGQLRDALFSQIDAWSGNGERGDDQTVLVLKVER